MKNMLYPVLIFATISLSSCELVGDIFKAGVWVGVFAVLAVIILVAYLVGKLSGKK